MCVIPRPYHDVDAFLFLRRSVFSIKEKEKAKEMFDGFSELIGEGD